MTYAMTLDNSWELMTEEEMYDVNGGWTKTTTEYLSGNAARIWIIDKIGLYRVFPTLIFGIVPFKIEKPSGMMVFFMALIGRIFKFIWGYILK
ncbi:hypothetical protein [Liberiplasma polymorphum]|uniref:hypothetical protein n=1 Tax=Liberiplasma polymorphum TaxID=3374570 RepID=UPI003775A8FD